MTEFLETDRLLLRPLKETDADRIFLLDSNPEVMKHIGVPPVKTINESLDVIKTILSQYEQNGIGRFAVVLKDSNELIGWSGLKFLTKEINEHIHVYELGYRFLPEYWGKGFATESATAWLDHGFTTMNINKIYACAHSENTSSNVVLLKLGFEKTGDFLEHDGLCYWYENNGKNYKN